MVIARAVQGIGAGGNMALVYIVLSDVSAPEKKAKTLVLGSLVWGISSVIGPSLKFPQSGDGKHGKYLQSGVFHPFVTGSPGDSSGRRGGQHLDCLPDSVRNSYSDASFRAAYS